MLVWIVDLSVEFTNTSLQEKDVNTICNKHDQKIKKATCLNTCNGNTSVIRLHATLTTDQFIISQSQKKTNETRAIQKHLCVEKEEV